MSNMARKFVSLVLMFLMVVGIFGSVLVVHVNAEESPLVVDYDQIIDTETEWIVSIQLDDGAIPTRYEGYDRIVPYFSNIAALGLLERPQYASNVKQWMDWYFAHVNWPDYNGLYATVYDYDVDPVSKVQTSREYYDSTDSYAATFISLCRKYYEVTGDAQYLIDNQSLIDFMGGAILGTMDSGLTFAKPDYRIKYLMDNSEVQKGLVDLVWLFNNVFDNAGAGAWYDSYRVSNESALESLWDSTEGIYRMYMDDAGNLGSTNMISLYPDATAQLFPIWEEVLEPDSERALSLYNKFNENHSGWPELNTSDIYPWSLIAYTSAIMGDKTRVDKFLDSVKASYIDQGHLYPWYCMEAGATILAAAVAKEISDVSRDVAITTHIDGSEINSLPFTISGTSQGIDKVELEFAMNLAETITKVEVNVNQDGSWMYEVTNLLNGDYTLTVIAKDKFNNVFKQVSEDFTASLGSVGARLSDVTLNSYKVTLKRSEATSLSLIGVMSDDSPANFMNADIEYVCSRPDLVEISSDGNLKLILMDKSIDHIDVWANATLNNEVVQSNKISIILSTVPMTYYDGILDVEAEYILNLQLDDGAIITCITDSSYKIDPRLANIAAMGLLERPEYAPNVKKYIQWYESKINWPDSDGNYGTVYNYEVNLLTLEETSTEICDSSAACIASFISLIKKYYEVTGDRLNISSLDNFRLDVMTGGIGMNATLDSDNPYIMPFAEYGDSLNWASQENRVKYLTDNLEVINGYKDSMWLFRNLFGNDATADWFEAWYLVPRVDAVETKFWDSETSIYKLSIDSVNEVTTAKWINIADAIAELSPIYTGVIKADSDRALSLYSTFNQNQPDWADLNFEEGIQSALIGYTASIVGDKVGADAFFKTVKTKYIDNSQPENWSSVQAGLTMLAAKNVLSSLFVDISEYPWASEQIEFLASKGIINGISDILFSPSSAITRADFTTLVVRALGIDATVTENFNDVLENDYFYNEIGIAKKLGIILGDSDGNFHPRTGVTKQDMIVIAKRALDAIGISVKSGTEDDLKKYTDASLISSYAFEAVMDFVKEGHIIGYNNMLSPKKLTTRAEAAVFIYRIYLKQ